LGFGILFATIITLLLVPSLYLIVDDVHQLFSSKQTVPIGHDAKLER